MNYRRKPIVVEAIQFDGVNHDEVVDFCAPVTTSVGGGCTLLVTTLEGTKAIYRGDWVIRKVTVDLQVCKGEVFEADYEAV